MIEITIRDTDSNWQEKYNVTEEQVMLGPQAINEIIKMVKLKMDRRKNSGSNGNCSCKPEDHHFIPVIV